jgi:hypothetical protein
MPTSISSTSGEVYHVFQLSTATSVKQFEESIEFTRIVNQLSDGFRSRRLLGSDTGLRRWNISLPTLAHSTIGIPTVTGVNGTTVSREEYLWELYCECEVSGEPFAIQSERDGQYYLCEFANERLSYEGMKVKLYSTGIELVQVRLDGETIFDPSLISGLWKWMGPNSIQGMTSLYGATTFTKSGDIIEGLITHNGLGVDRYNSVAATGRMSAPAATNVTIYDLFLVFKPREATYTQVSGIFTDNAAATAPYMIFGLNGQTNHSTIGAGYWLNGVKYTSTRPMNMEQFAIVRVQDTTGELIARPQVGQRDNGTTGFAEIDMAEMLVFTSRVSETNARLITEYLNVKWAIGSQ